MNTFSYILSFMLGFFASILGGAFLSYWQFIRSTAGYRLRKVEEATRQIIDEFKATNSYTGTIRNRHRYSLGVIIDILTKTYGTKDIPKHKSELPAMLKHDGDGWAFFNRFVRPVVNDINAYSFIGWFTLLPQMRKLRRLTELCEQLENLTAELDSIRLFSQSQSVEILDIKETGGTLEIIEHKDARINAKIRLLVNEYENLEESWRNWLKLVDCA